MENRYRKETIEALRKALQKYSSKPLSDEDLTALANNICQFLMTLEDIRHSQQKGK